MNTAKIDLQQLRIKHILYKSKVRSALYGGGYDEAFFSQQGPVNAWFEQTGLPKYKNEPEMQQLLHMHQDLKQSVNRLTDLYKKGKLEEAYEGLSSVEATSERFLKLVAQMEQRLGD